MAAINFVEYRRIERYADRVTMEPICTENLNDKELEMLKQSLKKQGYKYVGRSKDRYTTITRLMSVRVSIQQKVVRLSSKQ